jgi:hypothetical protein
MKRETPVKTTKPQSPMNSITSRRICSSSPSDKKQLMENQTLDSERGAVLVIAVLLLVVIVFVVSMSLNIGYSNVIQTDLQVAADSAAVSSAGALCASKACWRNAREVALETLESHVLRGSILTKAKVDFTGLENQLSTRWEFDGIRVTVQRGRWWPDRSEFESMESPDATQWQANHPGIPNIIGANAVRVTISRPSVLMFLNPFSSAGETGYSVFAEAIAAGGKQEDVCIAPFAYPMCSLINEDGDFDATTSCQFDRFLTESKRYCPPNTDCDVVPGAFWNPLPMNPEDFDPMSMSHSGNGVENCPPFFWAGDLKEYWHCPLSSDPTWTPSFVGYQLQSMMTGGSTTNLSNVSQEWTDVRGYMSQVPKFLVRGTRFNVPLIGEDEYGPGQPMGRASDQFGLVGLPVGPGIPSIDGANDEEEIRTVLSSSPPCLSARIGQRFKILAEGLQEPESDTVIWEQISNQLNGSQATHPKMVDTDLGYPAVTYRHRYDNIHWGIRDTHPPYTNSVSREYAFDRNESYGACNSKRWGYRGMRGESPEIAWSVIPSDPNDYRFSYLTSLIPGSFDYNFACRAANNYMFGYYDDVFQSDDVAGGTPLDENGRVWKISVPIISESCGDGAVQACRGINGETNDPLIDPSKEYEICAFIEVYVMDVDIGYDPPAFPRATCDSALTSGYHYPWGFDLEAKSADGSATTQPTRCNNVRTRPVCNARLLASSEHTGAATPTLVK